MKLPPEALEQLSTVGATLVDRGHVYWVSWPTVVYYSSTKGRYCIVAAVEPTSAGDVAHLVPGTSKRARGPALVVQPGEAELPKRTEFDFSTSFPLPTSQLMSHGHYKGELSPARLGDIDEAIRASGRTVLLRLTNP